MGKKKSFSAKLSLAILLATAGVYICSVVGIGALVVRAVEKEAVSKAESALSLAAAKIEQDLIGVQVATNSFAVLADEALPEEGFDITRKFLGGNHLIMGTSLAFPGGEFAPYAYRAADGEIIGKTLEYNYSDSDWFTVNEPSWCEPYYDDGGAYMLMTTYSVPLSNGRVLTADVSLSDITSNLAGVSLPYANAYSFLVSRKGKLLSDVPDANVKQFYSKMASGEKSFSTFKTEEDTFVIVYAPLSNGWSAAIVCPRKDIFADARKMNLILILVTLIGFGIIYFADKRLISNLTKPVLEFTASKERFERETAIASSIQCHMVPVNFPHKPGLDIFAAMLPAKEVGGDLYDFHEKGDELYFTIGDVSGKGVPAALFMAIARFSFRFVSSLGIPINEVVGRINNSICDGNDSNMFVTMFAGKYNRKTHVLEYCNAGHNPILVISPSGEASYLKAAPNIAVGLFENFEFKQESVQLEEGSRLLLYTDGVTEAETDTKDQFGEDRLLAFAGTCKAGDDAKQYVGNLLKSVHSFTAGAVQNDDITAMCIKL